MGNPASPPPEFVVRAVSRTDVGMRRSNNQDSVAVAPGGDRTVTGDTFLMVADGMGAHAAGELASKLAVEAIPHAFAKSRGEAPPVALRRAIRQANELIHAKGSSSAEFLGMGTTCSCLVFSQRAAIVGHVGDSRVYRLREGVFEQLTFDHSLVWEMAAASKVSEDRVPSCIPKNVITRSLGPHETVMVDLEGPHELRHGDVFLLCSDGLTGVVDDPLAGSLLGCLPPDHAAEALVNLANLRGGPDNISVVVAEVTAQSDASAVNPPLSTASGVAPSTGLERTLVYVAAAVCAVAAVGCLAAGDSYGAVAAAIGFGAAMMYAYPGRTTTKPLLTPSLAGDAFGNGPYRRVECGDFSAAAGDLRDLVRDLAAIDGDSAAGEDTHRTGPPLPEAPPPTGGPATTIGPDFDWGPFADRQRSADSAYESGDFRGAIAGYAAVIGAVLDHLRGDDGTHRYASRDGVLS